MLDSVHHYNELGRWYAWCVVIMPDHIHLILSCPRTPGLSKTIATWKGYVAKTQRIRWQSGFFEHRLRHDSDWTEKIHYMRNNPVARGLCPNTEDWPYAWTRGLW